MLRRTIVASFVTIGGALSFVNPSMAQTTSPSVNQMLNQTNQIIKEANDYNRNVAAPEAQRYQNYLYRLNQSCASGNSAACQEYGLRMRRQTRWQRHLDRQYTNWMKNRRYY